MIDHKNIDIEEVNQYLRGTLSETLGMVVTEIGTDYVVMTMPVDERTFQPMKILNGGANLALAESVGSLAGNLYVGHEHACVGLDINANHLKAVRSGLVHATAKPIHTGKTTHVWEIKITDDFERLVCISRLTLMVIQKK
jgi:1,4-dihydroxy-2-naphthoyl-CoA hydrolase